MRLKASILFLLLSALVLRAQNAPRLVVLIVVDQMRADYVDRFQADWSGGLKRLVSKGAWFNRAAYPYLDTVTCAGHATIGTGAFPVRHGVFQNSWFDRAANAVVTCTGDATAKGVAYGKSVAASESAARLMVPTFADEMRRQRSGHVVSLSLKARSAIMMAGHGGDAVTWLSDSLDGWTTSTAFATAPVPQVKEFVTANPIEADYGKTWNLLLPAVSYADPDAGVGETPPPGWTRSFPHVLRGNQGDSLPTDAYYTQWERSPFADAYLGRMAAALAESMQLGKHDTTDMLAVSFSSPDLVGHGFGPRSHEIREMYENLDRTLGTLFDHLDRLVGPDQYVVALSSDHGVTEIPEQLRADGRDGGRIDAQAIAQAVEQAAINAAGPGPYVLRFVGNDIYLAEGKFQKLAKQPGAVDAVIKAAAGRPGVGRVFRGDELVSATSSRDPLLRAAALDYVPDRGGDLMIAPKAGWMAGGLGTTHGSANPDDQRVPILLMGRGIKQGRYGDAASPADIAPTLASLCGITLPQAQGTVLRSALAK